MTAGQGQFRKVLTVWFAGARTGNDYARLSALRISTVGTDVGQNTIERNGGLSTQPGVQAAGSTSG